MLAIVPTIGPLHIDLNSDEDLVLNFHSLLKHIYEAVFSGKNLADHPKSHGGFNLHLKWCMVDGPLSGGQLRKFFKIAKIFSIVLC